MEVCPYCGVKTRRKGRKNGKVDKPSVNINLDGEE